MAPDSTGSRIADDPLWYQDAVIYQLHVKAFYDSNDDGIGDFRGLIQKLDYIQHLGVNTIWLLPFYPSPMRDDGYDIADYRNIYPDYGTRRDFRAFVRLAHRRGLRVITELVVNHTSDQHPWFQAARRSPPDSSKRNFYVWSDTDKKWLETRIIFTDTEKSNWAWDDEAKAYYWHRFFSHQPDLNFNNPQVVRAVTRLMRFWFDQGVDGVRLDAIPYLCERDGTNNENLPETHAVIKQMRAVVDEHYKNRLFLAEANQWPEDVCDYFGAGDECHMAYHFPLMPRMYMAIALEDRHPIVDIMRQTPEIPETCQWAIFLRNHDELTLEMVTNKERDYMYEMYAADRRMRINLGIRRRLAPLMDNNSDKIKLMNSLLLSMPGSPIIYYGDEIGMGDNIYLGDRNGVRTPMQWSPDRNAGFSRADPQRLYLPPIMDPLYGHEAVNVEAQLRDTSSLLNWMKRVLGVRTGHRAFGRGRLAFLRPGNRKILAYLREFGADDIILCVANLSRSAQPVELDLARFKGRVPLELMGRTPFPPIGELPYLLTLSGYGFYWFLLSSVQQVPAWHEERLPPEDRPVLVLFDGWRSFFRERVDPRRIALADKARAQLENELLPAFLSEQRWYAAKGKPIERAAIFDCAEWQTERATWLLPLIKAEGKGDAPAQTYCVPLSLVWENGDEARMRGLLPFTIAKVREKARIGILGDAYGDELFCRALVQAMGNEREIACSTGRLRFSATRAFAELGGEDVPALEIATPGAVGSNTTVAFGNRLFVKGYRRLQEGISLELEIGRFLTEVVGFANTVPVAGALEYEGTDGTKMTLALLQGYVNNQGDGWSFTMNYLKRFLEERRAGPPELPTTGEEPQEIHGAYLTLITTLGVRTAELHKALATQTGDAAFDPEPITQDDMAVLVTAVRDEAIDTMDMLAAHGEGISSTAAAGVEALLQLREDILKRIESTPTRINAIKTRYHGDYHLGQVLLAENDFVIIDFEGEPARPLSERRTKHSALKDVAGMLRSFNYAAYATLYEVTAENPNDLPVLKPFANEWERKAAQAFLNGYEHAIDGCQVFPEDPEQARSVIDLFTMEKAFYEVRYEFNNRPEWAKIPLRGILALLQTEETTGEPG
jgi:maltose alpha-D-glucosyltransferase/alpha-amylase